MASPSSVSSLIAPAFDLSSLLSSVSAEFSKTHTSARGESTLVSSSRSAVFPSITTTISASPIPTSPAAKTIASASTRPITSSTLSSSSISSALSSPTTGASAFGASSSVDNRTLIIILAVCFTILALLVLLIAAILLKRYRQGQPPFSHLSRRGASPIDDEEIATWRGNTQEMAKTPSSHLRNASSIVFQSSPGWTWNVSSSPSTSPPGSGSAIPYPPPVVARAPNARSGLTDEAIPGADPFVAPARRHSRRISKSQSASHLRNKSRRSSVSVSIRERPSISTAPWVEPDDWAVTRGRSNSRNEMVKTPSGRTSIGDDEQPGGLSPRPVTAPNARPPLMPGSAY